MTAKAYEEYKAQCEEMRIKPSKLSDLTKDPQIHTDRPHIAEPVHIRKPFDYTGKRKTLNEQFNALPEDAKFTFTKKQLLELERLIREDAACG